MEWTTLTLKIYNSYLFKLRYTYVVNWSLSHNGNSNTYVHTCEYVAMHVATCTYII